MAEQETSKRGNMDFATFVGLLIAGICVIGGLILEGGQIADITQPTAALIVIGGTLGAVMVSTPQATLKGASKRLMELVHDPSPPLGTVLEQIIRYAGQARKQGLTALETEANKIGDPFLRRALLLAIDGADLQELRDMLRMEVDLEEARADEEARVLEGAGGYAPTIGIIGAVMGLIQVMKNLADIEEVGHGIAVAFVATIYGVGMANLLFLPAAQKIKARAAAEARRKELITEGVVGLVEGLNPKLLRIKLEAFAGVERSNTGY